MSRQDPPALPSESDESAGVGRGSSIASAMWLQRGILAERRERVRHLLEVIGGQQEFSAEQGMALYALVLQERPDIILEFGRLMGNSTAVLTDAANCMANDRCRVISICLTPHWNRQTLPRLLPIIGHEWLTPLTALQADILTMDYSHLLRGCKRALIFWDAHGYAVAECILGAVLPALNRAECTVVCHDMADGRYVGNASRAYRSTGVWQGNDWSGRFVWLDNLVSNVEQAVAIVDFASRNNISVESASHGLHASLSPAEQATLTESLQLPHLINGDVGLHLFKIPANRDISYPRFKKPGILAQYRGEALRLGFSLAVIMRAEEPVRRLGRLLRSIRRRLGTGA